MGVTGATNAASQREQSNMNLALAGFGAAFGDRVVLSNLDFEIQVPSMNVLMGPAGEGKSTFLRTLAGVNELQAAFRRWGECRFDGKALSEANRPYLVAQHARLLMSTVLENLVSALPNRSELGLAEQRAVIGELLERYGLGCLMDQLRVEAVALPLGLQRRLAIVRGVATGSKILLLDEPAAGLPDEEVAAVTELARQLSQDHGVIVVTHNQQTAQALGGTSFLLAGGRILESAPTAEFFASPQTDAGRTFVATGRCSVASPGTPPEALAEGVTPAPPVPEEHRHAPAASVGPRGFYWIERGLIGGLPRPGIVSELRYDLEGLQRLGVTDLLTLEEAPTVPPDALEAHGVRAEHFPIVDMEPPELEAAQELCKRLVADTAAGSVVAVHCRAGLGRTGTILACYLIEKGVDPLTALERVRRVQPRAIQSDSQVAFLQEYADAKTSPKGEVHSAE